MAAIQPEALAAAMPACVARVHWRAPGAWDPHEDLGAQDASDGWCSTASASVAWMSWDALAPHRMLATLTRTQRQTLTGAPARFTERGAIARLDDGT